MFSGENQFGGGSNRPERRFPWLAIGILISVALTVAWMTTGVMMVRAYMIQTSLVWNPTYDPFTAPAGVLSAPAHVSWRPTSVDPSR